MNLPHHRDTLAAFRKAAARALTIIVLAVIGLHSPRRGRPRLSLTTHASVPELLRAGVLKRATNNGTVPLLLSTSTSTGRNFPTTAQLLNIARTLWPPTQLALRPTSLHRPHRYRTADSRWSCSITLRTPPISVASSTTGNGSRSCSVSRHPGRQQYVNHVRDHAQIADMRRSYDIGSPHSDAAGHT